MQSIQNELADHDDNVHNAQYCKKDTVIELKKKVPGTSEECMICLLEFEPDHDVVILPCGKGNDPV